MKNIITLFIYIYILYGSYLHSQDLEQCNYFTKKYEKIYNLPNNLLTSIALVESGIKKKKNQYTSWPWTLNVSGKSFYFDHRNELLDFLNQNFTPQKSIDVGCMQINTRYHLKNFNNLDELVDPEKNVRYAAIFLSKLYKKYKSWNEAISRYHSSIPKNKKRYLNKVQTFWNNIRQKKIILKSDYISSSEKEQINQFRKILKSERL
ncbi:MAG: transglycosylase SLT domain-containing protein [Alphaproteobacteria bacterium]